MENSVSTDTPADKADAPKFRRKSLQDLMAVPEPEWLIQGMIPKGGFIEFFGPKKSMKTFVLLHLAWCLTGGKDFGPYRAGRAYRTLYLLGEGGWPFFRHRALALDWSVEQGENIEFLELPSFTSEDFEPFVQHLLDDPPEVLILDTRQRATPGVSDNDEAGMKLFVERVDALRERVGVTVIEVHHTGHSNTDRGRGHSVIDASLDASFLVTLEGRQVRVENKLNRHAEGGLITQFRWESIELVDQNFRQILDEHGEPARSVCLHPLTHSEAEPSKDDRRRSLIREMLRERGPLSPSKLNEEFPEGLGFKSGEVKEGVKKLMGDEVLIEPNPRGRGRLVRLSQLPVTQQANLPE